MADKHRKAGVGLDAGLQQFGAAIEFVVAKDCDIDAGRRIHTVAGVGHKVLGRPTHQLVEHAAGVVVAAGDEQHRLVGGGGSAGLLDPLDDLRETMGVALLAMSVGDVVVQVVEVEQAQDPPLAGHQAWRGYRVSGLGDDPFDRSGQGIALEEEQPLDRPRRVGRRRDQRQLAGGRRGMGPEHDERRKGGNTRGGQARLHETAARHSHLDAIGHSIPSSIRLNGSTSAGITAAVKRLQSQGPPPSEVPPVKDRNAIE